MKFDKDEQLKKKLIAAAKIVLLVSKVLARQNEN
jgi:hypothetical protein